MGDQAELAYLHWQTRRGTQELEVILRWYLDHQYHHLPVHQQQCFVKLLGRSDDWLTACLVTVSLCACHQVEHQLIQDILLRYRGRGRHGAIAYCC